MKIKKYFDEISYIRAYSEVKRAWNVIDRMIGDLKNANQPLFWDVLFNSLGGDSLRENYAKRFAEEFHEDWTDQDTRNRLRKKFKCLADPYYKTCIDKRYLKHAEDGSFTLDEDFLAQDLREKHTYRFSEKQAKAVDYLSEAIKELGFVGMQACNYFGIGDDGELIPVVSKLKEWVK